MRMMQKKIQIFLFIVGILLILITYFYFPYKNKSLVEKTIQENVPPVSDSLTEKSTSFENIEYQGFYDLDKTFVVKSEKGYIEDAVIGKNDKEQTNIWGIREDVSVLADERKYDQHFDISIPTSSIGKIIDRITNELLENNDVKTIFPFGHVADGNIHFIIGKDSDKESITREVNEIIYSNIESVNGSISAEHGIGIDKKEYLKNTRNKDEIDLMRLLKKSIDPKNILNPGRIL